ncbi:hypothetical protein Dda_1446 [Drechslerella dactyloides]|uniref:GRIP domain-containing protein n=1 Tax=Drechslerella dactyloides TaxID=74499 RepID=A0AAD6J1R3_DREDA|nr:hypothetical protein Dda_1446 [Drechslerella dactyloides]
MSWNLARLHDTMFTRLKNFADSLEESARTAAQRNLASPQPTIQRTPSTRRDGSSGGPSSTAKPRNAVSALKDRERERDPAEFDSDFSSEGGMTPRTGTPVPPANGGTAAASSGVGTGDEKKTGGESQAGEGGTERKDAGEVGGNDSGGGGGSSSGGGGNNSGGTFNVAELPSEIRLKLRKLEKIESKYSELLRSYRITHAKVQQIDPFEKVLRETTPCTSIGDPAAFTEYLNNLSLRSDMTMEEFKRVSQELGETKKELAKYKKESEDRGKEIATLKDRVVELEAKSPTNGVAPRPPALVSPINGVSGIDLTEKVKSPGSMSISSLKPKPDEPAEFFSYEDEHDRLDALVKEQETEISTLKTSLDTAKTAAKVAEEAAQVFQKNVEDSQRELEGMRETMVAKDGEIRRLVEESTKLEKQVEELNAELKTAKESAGTAPDTVKVDKKDGEATVDAALLEQAKKDLDFLKEEHDKLKLQITTSEDELAKIKSEYESKTEELQKERDEKLKASDDELESLKAQKAKEIEDLEGKIEELEGETIMLKAVSDELTSVREAKLKVEKLLKEADSNKQEVESRLDKVKREKTALESKTSVLEDRLLEAARKLKEQPTPKTPTDDKAKPASGSQDSLAVPDKGLTASQKRNRSRRNKKKRETATLTDKTFKPEDEEEDAEPSKDGETVPEIVAPTSPRPDEEELSTADLIISNLRVEIAALRKESEEAEIQISRLRGEATRANNISAEFEVLQESFLNISEECVEAKDRVRELLQEKKALESSKRAAEEQLAKLTKEMENVTAESKKIQGSHEAVQLELGKIKTEAGSLSEKLTQLTREFDEHKASTDSLSSESSEKYDTLKKDFDAAKAEVESTKAELTIAQQLAATRFKDLAERKALLEKFQAELNGQRSEVTKLTAANGDMTQKLAVLKRLEKAETDLKAEVESLKRRLSERENDLDSVRERARTEVRTETTRRTKAEDQVKALQKDLRVCEEDRKEAQDLVESLSKDLTRAQDELSSLRPKLVILERETQKLRSERDGFQEEIDLKTAQHSSAQSLMSSLRDQTSELAMQMKELKERNESMEEELAEAQKLLSERSREAETMRRLLRDVETKQDTRIREMKERMDQAIDERDKAEEESATVNKRRMRELEDIKDKLREAEKSLKRIQEEKSEAEKERNSLKGSKEKAEQALESASNEFEETKKAMLNMRDALDETEKQMRDFDKQKAELRKQAEDIQHKYEKLQKAYRIATDELRMIQNAKTRVDESSRPASRQSLDKPMSPTRRGSATPSLDGSGSETINIDYIKNIVLQSLEVKNKKMQIQMLPVLKMLLRFDEKDEQRWMTIMGSIK